MNETVIFSPVSIINVLALVSLAAHGNTYDQMKRGLYLNDNKTYIANQFQAFNGFLQNSGKQTTLMNVNQIYINNYYTLNKTFQEVAVQKFACGIKSLNVGNSIAAAQTINEFIAAKTHNKITNSIQPESIPDDIAVILMNAIYFKSIWKHKFDKTLTTPDDFYVSENETVSIDFVKIQSNFGFRSVHEKEADVLGMEYANSEYSFIVLLPWSRTGLSKLEIKLKNFDLTKTTRFSRQLGVDVKLP